ncbi:sensor histidine kinase [Paenibacillus sp. CAA11]|uniref:ATP-binding protein n=1 Tax=Paenibacillus sp. CAA11 TaxID=1532905 RepID=UPI000D3D8F05|nr:ATP-binding protein [Paenibacillus sp. CAA11]AWB43254.1 sensor histidine kinase [Paenibacillus sp. CAA11]
MESFGDAFLLNLGMLVTTAYLANLIYKYAFAFASRRIKYVSAIVLVIFAGWVSMYFGLRLSEEVIFDLRVVPLIIAALSSIGPSSLLLIGVGIGACRFTFGYSEAALAGFLNLAIVGVVAALLQGWLSRSGVRYGVKAAVILLTLNIVNSLNIGWLGVIPFKEYAVEIMPITLPLGTLLSIGFALIFRDFQMERRRIVDLKEANQLLKRQTEDLHKTKIILEERAKQLMLASQYKSEFLANMSHELRTPLNSIINLAQLIAESGKDHPDDENVMYGEIIHKSGEDLLQLINDILDLSKVEAGRLEIVEEEVSVLEIPEMLRLQFEHTALRKGLEFEIEQEETLPVTIHSDPQRIQQILRNLLANAFKFTEEGKVKLEIRESGPEDQLKGKWIIFAVSDTGIGIPKDKHQTIFEAFQQADSSISRKYGGTGLGLSISRDLARLLGGFIRLQSKEGAGSTFSLYLPLR